MREVCDGRCHDIARTETGLRVAGVWHSTPQCPSELNPSREHDQRRRLHRDGTKTGATSMAGGGANGTAKVRPHHVLRQQECARFRSGSHASPTPAATTCRGFCGVRIAQMSQAPCAAGPRMHKQSSRMTHRNYTRATQWPRSVRSGSAQTWEPSAADFLYRPAPRWWSSRR